MTEHIWVSGLVATTPRHIETSEGVKITSFRLASSSRYYDYSTASWVDGNTNWYTITSYGDTAVNVAGSISKGERIVVAGLLRLRDWDNGDNTGTTVEIEAEAIGHDLTWGTSVFTRNVLVRNTEPKKPKTEITL